MTEQVVLGLVQGITEFLPISSSAHLAVLPRIMQWKDYGLAYDVALHMGSLVAVVWALWPNLFSLGRACLPGGDRIARRRLAIVIIATIPGALAGALFEDYAATVFRNPNMIACAMAVMGGILWLADAYATRKGNAMPANTEIPFKSALIIGLAQALAIVPGVSRSGATMSAGLFLGLSRKDTALFSFLLSIPIIAGAGIYEMPKLAGKVSVPELLPGMLSAFVAGFLAIRFLLAFVSRYSYKIFAVYRFIFAAAVFILL